MPFMTTGNATVYIRVMIDEKIYLATCSQFDFLIRQWAEITEIMWHYFNFYFSNR